MNAMIFQSFFMGGFECSTHRNHHGNRLDLIAATRHDKFAEADYSRMMENNLETARDGLRWHLIEKEPFKYDFSSAENQVRAARKTGIQIIWDLFHYGYPDDLDIFSDAFPERFVRFTNAATNFLADNFGDDLFLCPVNEISFFSWAAAEVGAFYPFAKKRGDQLKRQLITTAILSIEEIKTICPAARIVFTDPAIHVVPKNASASAIKAAESYRLAQFEAFDMISGGVEPELGGKPEYLDIIGLNYYFHNQWRHPSRRKIPLGHKDYRPLYEILREYHERYQRPLFIAETGIENDERPDWFRYVGEQTEIARLQKVPIEGVCLYPIVNHPGWADNRHCHNGLWDYCDSRGGREIYKPLADEIKIQIKNFSQFRPPQSFEFKFEPQYQYQ